MTIGNRYCISCLSRHRSGRRGEALPVSQMPLDESARGHGRARVNKCAALLGTGVLPCSKEGSVSPFRPMGWANCRRGISPFWGLRARKHGLRGTAVANARSGELCAWEACTPSQCLGGLCALRASARPKRPWGKTTDLPAPHPQTWDHEEGELLKPAVRGFGVRTVLGLGRRGAAMGPSLFSAAPPSVLFRPSARPRP